MRKRNIYFTAAITALSVLALSGCSCSREAVDLTGVHETETETMEETMSGSSGVGEETETEEETTAAEESSGSSSAQALSVRSEIATEKNGKVSMDFSQGSRIALNEQRLFNSGYLFLQCLVTRLRMDKICRSIASRHKFQYDLHTIFTDLIYARILHPSSKRETYEYCRSLLEPPKYHLQDVYRALSVIAAESDFIQSELYRNSNFVHPRNKKILYYDCTNFYFETEEEDALRKYGKSKEHRPNPIVTMGLFMDADGIPLSFDIFPGNQNEQTTLKPLEQKIIRDFDCSEFIFCSDSGLGSLNNRRFNSFSRRAYVITHSLKKMKEEERKAAMDPTQFRKIGSQEFIDLRTLDETLLPDYERGIRIQTRICSTGRPD